MTVIEFLNRILCNGQVQVMCFENGSYFELAIWCCLFIVGIFLYRIWIEGPYYKKPTRIDGKVVIVTGCNTGIGKEIALELAKRGGRIYMACRNYEKCEKARLEIIQQSGNTNVFNRTLDLQSFKSIRKFAESFEKEEERLDILINNAGLLSSQRQESVDGFELHFAVNYLGPFLLTYLLLGKMISSGPSRIVVMASIAYLMGKIDKNDINLKKSYHFARAYGRSKLANILFTRKLAQILKDTNVTVNCLHPGCIKTELTRSNSIVYSCKTLIAKLLRTPKGGAQTAVYLAIDPELENLSGGYYDRMALGSLLAKAKDDEMADWLWHQSVMMAQIKKPIELTKIKK